MDKQMDMEYCLPVNCQALLRMAEEELSGEQVEKLMGLLENTKGADRCSDSQVRNIILECGQVQSVHLCVRTVRLRACSCSLYLKPH